MWLDCFLISPLIKILVNAESTVFCLVIATWAHCPAGIPPLVVKSVVLTPLYEVLKFKLLPAAYKT